MTNDTARTVVGSVAGGLVRHGVAFILRQSVPTTLALTCEDCGIRNIMYRLENMGGAIADGFARVFRRAPVMLCQNGPAAALAVAPFAEAMKAGVPIVAIMQEETVKHARDLDAALDRAAKSETLALLDVITDPGCHPPLALYNGTLDRLQNRGVIQNPVP